MRIGKLTHFELLQVRFWVIVLSSLSLLVARASGANPKWESFESALQRIENLLDEIGKIGDAQA